MKKNRWLKRLSLLFLVLIGGLGFLIWDFFQDETVSQLTINQTYDAYNEFKLLKNNRWVMLIDNSDYESQDELEDERVDNYPEEVYPEMTFLEGIYKKEGDKYYFCVLKSATITFKSVKAVKEKKIFKKAIKVEKEKNYISDPILVKQDDVYIYRDISIEQDENGREKVSVEDVEVYPSDNHIPNSVSQFLKQFKLVSSTK